MANPIKIFELKGEDWAKGLSYSTSFPVGGIFQTAVNTDPFVDYGYLTPSLTSVTTDATKTATPTVITSWNNGGTAYIYAHTPTKLYQILDGSPYTTTDVSSEIIVTDPVSAAIIWKNKYIYQVNNLGILYSNSLPVASGSNTMILGSAFATTEYYHPMTVAPDKNLYIADYGQINRCVSATSTTGNAGAYYLLEDFMAVRDLTSDGKYLIAIADNNASFKIGSSGAPGNYRCQILFYDVNNGRSTADYIYEFSDSNVRAVKFLDGAVYIFGQDNLWVCNSQTPPKSIFRFTAGSGSSISTPPVNPFQVTVRGNSIHWVASGTTTYAYGSLVSGMKKVFYSPHTTSSNQSAIVSNGTNFYIGNTGNNQMVQVTGTGSTRALSGVQTTQMSLPQSYTFGYIKVTLKDKLSNPGSVYVGMRAVNNNEIVTDATTKAYSQIGAKQTIIFDKQNNGSTASVTQFIDFNLTVQATQAIAKVEVYAYPTDNYEQRL